MQRAPVGLQVVRELMGAGVVGWWWHRDSFPLGILAAKGKANRRGNLSASLYLYSLDRFLQSCKSEAGN
jgi:hypothetical protein